MKGKYDYNPVEIFYQELVNVFTKEYIGDNDYDEIDKVLKLILLNNGCKIDSDSNPQEIIRIIIPDEYEIRFITGMIGNDANEFYDFLIFNGKKVLIIFEDYFNFVTSGDLNPNNPLYSLKLNMGNSIYYDAIKKIVEVFYLTSEPMPGGLLTTAMATTQRWNQAIIAINIINHFKPVDEYDISDISMEDIEKILNTNQKIQLYGIRNI
jgi:hypothetical protein